MGANETTTAPVTAQEVLDHIAEKAKGGATFRLKVTRRPNAASPIAQHVATFSDATWPMIADAETWLGALAGGGLYVIQVFDQASSKHVGTLVPAEIPGPPRPINAAMTKGSGWNGPNLIEAPGSGGNGAIPLSIFQAPDPYGAMPPPRTSADPTGIGSLFSSQMEELRRRELEVQTQAHRAELEAVKRSADDRARQLQEQLSEVRNALKDLAAKPPPPPPPEKPGIDLEKFIVGALGAVAPLVTAWLESQKSTRAALAAAEEKRAEAAARERHEALEMEEKRLTREAARADAQAKRMDQQMEQFTSFLKMNAEANKANMESNSIATRQMFQTIANMTELSSKLGQPEESGFNWRDLAAGLLQGFAALKGMPGAPRPPGAPSPQLAGAPQPAQAPVEVDGAPQLDAIEDKIIAKRPPDEIVSDLKACMEAPEVKAEVEAFGGWPNVFEDRLGSWSKDPANEPYIAVLIPALSAAGIFPAGAA